MVKDGDTPLYLMGDHLGSTSLVVNTSGAQVARRSYLPFGAQWAASGRKRTLDCTTMSRDGSAQPP